MSENPVFDRIREEVSSSDVVLFMKGTPVFPQCGFSNAVVQVLTYLNVPFKGVNVLEDGEIREGIKQFSDWPTIPQLYVKGEFVGGCVRTGRAARIPRPKRNRSRRLIYRIEKP